MSICITLFTGSRQTGKLTVLTPILPDSIVIERGQLFLLSQSNTHHNTLLAGKPWEIDTVIIPGSSVNVENALKNIYSFIPPISRIEQITLTYIGTAGKVNPVSLTFTYAENVTCNLFPQSSKFPEFMSRIRNSTGPYCSIEIRGWYDTIYTPIHEDPADPEHQMYAIPVQLIPGENRVYFTDSGEQTETVEFFTRFVTDSRSIQHKKSRFHGSPLASFCSACHTELPGSSNNESTPNSCGMCHAAITAGTMKHGPATEPEACSTCHDRSAAENVDGVPLGIPGICYNCHTEKKTETENSVHIHRGATDCVICHSPHASEEKYFLKTNVYRLCTGCHPDQASDHPVDKHPVRFLSVREESTEQISCVSCHNPHGSNNPALIKTDSDRTTVCLECHQK